MSGHLKCCGGSFWLYIAFIVGLVLFAGMMSGLTLGLMSLDLVDLEVLMKSGGTKDRRYASRIYPVVKRQHLLLCTLLICNALAMEALPIFLDKLVAAWGAILISVTLVLLFGEIIPQAICSTYGLAVGATLAPFVRVLVWIVFPLSYPISKLLDLFLGKGHTALFRRAELKTLVGFHEKEAGKGGDLTHDETTIIAGALDLTEKSAGDAMTPIESTFSIDVNAKLDAETMNRILTKGHSRVPVYSGKPTNIIGLLLVKNLLSIRPEDETPVRNATIRKIPRVPESIPLYDLLNEFQKGHSHMAVVARDSKGDTNRKDIKLEKRLSSIRSRKVLQGSDSQKHIALDIPDDSTSQAMRDTYGHKMVSFKKPSSSFKGDADGKVFDRTLSGQRKQKWERAKTEDILKVDFEALPNFSNNEEAVGIITMEDVIEELLQEEILDETDEYIDVHNKIRVNMLAPEGKSPNSALSSSLPTAAVSPLSSLQQTPVLTSPVPSVHHTPAPDSPTSPHLLAPGPTPTKSTSPRSPVSGLPLSNFLHSSGSKNLSQEKV
ncbi:hypothetical protein O6H91_20G008400 [Diphasiastrum complanatum]|uniref:Uncharacterized protein n=1 Tax=Diphasiastrum complanatum TaxID=34168 RepID=A0ACC2AML5_DIPCM|nr:hypothetical protein O6H91_20G008400 [Diphasiastrum complanatum]